jgi:hypothetical protein
MHRSRGFWEVSPPVFVKNGSNTDLIYPYPEARIFPLVYDGADITSRRG